ncbi:MAG TPA: DNA gyrase inhibitor YacG [Candidatus Acidoferrales bacterium]|nr:DNA gyrase inhibitor YacG [Candidatus Acidoferrales bacterium]
MMPTDTIRGARCPRCGKTAAVTDNPFRPFCSERCKLIDLGAWLGEAYRIPAEHSPESTGETDDPNQPEPN